LDLLPGAPDNPALPLKKGNLTMGKNETLITQLLLSFLPFAGFSQNGLTSGVFIKNVMVPQQEIALDSIVAPRFFYSGNAYYDLEAQGPAQVHIYLEEIPFEPYTIILFTKTGDTHYCGHARFVKIDSLCSGDVGIVQGKTHCSIKWSYSTTNPANHCRIKIGLGNYLYAKTQDSLEGQIRWTYTYNCTGTIASTMIDSIDVGSIGRKVVVPKYTKGGQIMIDDTSHPFAVNGYDEKERMTYAREASTDGLILHYIYGFVYDTSNRVIEQQMLQFESSPENPGQPFNTIYYSYDSAGRLKTETQNRSFIFNNPIFWPVSVPFDTKLVTNYFYNQDFSKPCSSVAMYYDLNRNLMPLSRGFQQTFFSAAGRIDSTFSIEQGLDSPGTVYGPRTYRETRRVPVYDDHDFAYRSMTWYKYFSPDSPFVRDDDGYCYRREYDNAGNIIKQFDYCDTNEQLAWSMKYNEFNAPIMQEDPDQSIPGKSFRTWYTWDLLDLDTTKEHLHD
jgi:hypothetical protein